MNETNGNEPTCSDTTNARTANPTLCAGCSCGYISVLNQRGGTLKDYIRIRVVDEFYMKTAEEKVNQLINEFGYTVLAIGQTGNGEGAANVVFVLGRKY